MKDAIFREYDIRGIVDEELNISQVYDLGCAIAYYFKQENPNFKTLSVGMDGRTHSPAIKEAISKAFQNSGINILFLGLCPTPALYFSLYTLKVDGGIMITASHNGPEYNGMKICLGHTTIWGPELQAIKLLYKKKITVSDTQKATYAEYDIIPDYVSYLANAFRTIQNINVSAVIDCGNGVAATVLTDLIKAMKWQNVKLLFEKVDGTFPNHEADPTVAKNMVVLKRTVLSKEYKFGIGFDGDCDRMVPMTKEGDLVPGDQLLAVFAAKVISEHPGAGIVFDIKSSNGLIELIEKWGGNSIMAPSGHSIIKDMMFKHKALLGGELSCHFFFKDRYFGYDDGIYAMMRLIEQLFANNKSLKELISLFPQKYSSREFRLPCPDDKKNEIVAAIKKELETNPNTSLITIDGIRASFPFGWGIIRASNTQAALSMRFESETKKGLAKVIAFFRTLLTPYLTVQTLNELHEEK